MGNVKKKIALILASVMSISSIQLYTATAAEAEQSNTTEIEVGETYEVNMDSRETLDYTFVPEADGEYIFWSEGVDNAYADLLDSQMWLIAESDYVGESFDFQLSASLKAGETYTLRIRNYISEAKFYIKVARDTFSMQYDADITVLYGDDAELVVNAESEEGEAISYQWYKKINGEYEYILIEGATNSVYRIKTDDANEIEDGYEEYKCIVKAGEREKTAYVSVSTDTGLILDYPRYQYGLEGDSITLEIQAKSKLQNLTYSWYTEEDEEGEPIEISNNSSYTFTLTESGDYHCWVSDGMNRKWASIQVDMGEAGEKRVKSILSAEPTKIYFYDLTGNSMYHSSSVQVRYDDGTEGTESELEDWDTIEKDEHGDWIAGKYKGYISCKGAISSYDIFVIRNSDSTELIMDNELEGEFCDETTVFRCYKISVPETDKYVIEFSNIIGSGQCKLSDGVTSWYGEISEDDRLDVSLEEGKDYYLAVISTDNEELSYNVQLKSYWQTIAVDETVTIEKTTDMKYIPQKSGLYRWEKAEADKDKREYVYIYDKDMNIICSSDYWMNMNLNQFYLSQGETYYFRISHSDEMSREFIFKNVEYVEYPSSIIVAGKYEGLSWELDESGVLSIKSEDGKMPASPWDSGEKIKKIEWGSDFIEIDSGAFAYCNNLVEVQFPESVENIGSGAFRGCDKLEKLELPASLKKIDSSAFAYCSELKEIDFSSDIMEIGSSAFQACDKLEKIELPACLNKIDVYAFADCSNLKNVTLPDKNNLTDVGNGAFSRTEWEKEQEKEIVLGDVLLGYQNDESNVVIPTGIYYIADGAFTDSKLDTISFSSTLKKIGEFVFCRCQNLKQLTIPGNVTDIAYRAFEECTALESIVLEEGVHSLDRSVFIDCNMLKEVTIPKSVEQIGDYAVGYVHGLNGLKKAENLPIIYCYSNSAAYTYAIENEIPYVLLDAGADTTKPSDNPSQSEKPSDNIGSTGEEKLSDTTNTPQTEKPSDSSPEQIITPDTVKTVQSGACEYEVTSTDTVTLTGLKKSKTKKLSIPKTITVNGTKYKVVAIADNVFKNAKITSLTIGSNVKTIGTSAYENCKNLTKVTIGSGVTKLGKNVFKNCKKLKNITIKSTKLKAVGKNAFKGIKSMARIKVPKKKLNAYKKMLKKAGIGKKVQIVK